MKTFAHTISLGGETYCTEMTAEMTRDPASWDTIFGFILAVFCMLTPFVAVSYFRRALNCLAAGDHLGMEDNYKNGIGQMVFYALVVAASLISAVVMGKVVFF